MQIRKFVASHYRKWSLLYEPPLDHCILDSIEDREVTFKRHLQISRLRRRILSSGDREESSIQTRRMSPVACISASGTYDRDDRQPCFDYLDLRKSKGRMITRFNVDLHNSVTPSNVVELRNHFYDRQVKRERERERSLFSLYRLLFTKIRKHIRKNVLV